MPTRPPTPAADAAAPASDDARVDALAQEFLDFIVDTSPETASWLGVHTRDGDLDDRSQQGEASLVARERALFAKATELAKSPRLSVTGRTDAQLLEAAMEVDLRRRDEVKALRRMPEVYAAPMHAIFFLLARDYAPVAERAKNAITRMEKIPQTIAWARENLAPSAAIPAPPKVWVQVGIEMAASATSFFDEQRATLSAALPAEKARIEQAILTAKKAYAEYKTFLEKDVLPRATGSFATGKPHFDFLLRRGYFLDEDSEQVLAMGERILAQTDAQMTELARKMDPKAKGWPEVTARLKGKHPTAEELLSSYRREVKRARDFLEQKDAVAFPPGDVCEVIDTPVFLRTTMTAGYEQPPPFDKATTKGLFYVTPIDRAASKAKQEEMLRENDFADQVNTAVHEAYPGHHLQLSFARRHPSTVRKMLDASIFSEGWGLYSEELMAELGYYSDAERLMQLEWTLVRAARVVIDVGLHTKGMSFEDAVKILTDKVHLERPLALSEVKRYTASPTQPLSYLVGREAIFKLRDRYKQREGAKYTLRGFHTEVLAHGTVPPGLIAREVFGE